MMTRPSEGSVSWQAACARQGAALPHTGHTQAEGWLQECEVGEQGGAGHQEAHQQASSAHGHRALAGFSTHGNWPPSLLLPVHKPACPFIVANLSWCQTRTNERTPTFAYVPACLPACSKQANKKANSRLRLLCPFLHPLEPMEFWGQTKF